MSAPRLICHDQFRPAVQREFILRAKVIRIGADASKSDVCLESNFLPPVTAELHYNDGGWSVKAVASSLVYIGDGAVPLRGGESEKVSRGSVFRLHHWICKLVLPDRRAAIGPDLMDRSGEALKEIHAKLLAQRAVPIVTNNDDSRRFEQVDYLKKLESVLKDLIDTYFREVTNKDELVRFIGGQAVKSDLIARYYALLKSSDESPWDHHEVWTQYQHANDAIENDVRATVGHCDKTLRASLERNPQKPGTDDLVDLVDQQFESLWSRLDIAPQLLWYLTERHLIKQVKDIIWGFGPLEDLLRIPAVSEIMVVDRSQIYVERSGVIQDSGRQFLSNDVTRNIIDRIVAIANRSVNQSTPLVDARLPDGSRVNAIIPPLAVTGPCLTIRKFPKNRLRLRDLAAKGAFSDTVRKFLEASVADHRNILIAGGTGTGKTTLLNAMSDAIDARERIVTIEDTAELQIGQEHVVSLQAKPPNPEGKGGYDIRSLVRNALRMRPDRIIVGECRGAEALDMLQAMNTGHDGSMTTIHANTPRDVIGRLVVLVQSDNSINMPVSSIYHQIASAIDLVVQLTRLGSGRRIVTQVTEVAGLDDQGEILLRDIFALSGSPGEEKLAPTGRLPTFIHRITNDLSSDAKPDSRKLDLSSFYV